MSYEHFSWDTLDSIHVERERQIIKWGPQVQNHGKWMLILQEELGEVSKNILENNNTLAKRELIQAAAVILAWLEEGYW